MNVMIIPEDFRQDQYLLKPIFERLIKSIQPSARVEVLKDPLLGGVEQALNPDVLQSVIDDYSYKFKLFLLCVDRDGKPGRRQQLDKLEAHFSSVVFLAENAWEELETWGLAGAPLEKSWVWAELRADVSVKERYFQPWAAQNNCAQAPGGGRKKLGEIAAGHLDAIRQKCPDFDAFAQRIAAALA